MKVSVDSGGQPVQNTSTYVCELNNGQRDANANPKSRHLHQQVYFARIKPTLTQRLQPTRFSIHPSTNCSNVQNASCNACSSTPDRPTTTGACDMQEKVNEPIVQLLDKTRSEQVRSIVGLRKSLQHTDNICTARSIDKYDPSPNECAKTWHATSAYISTTRSGLHG
jgi:hypothetical protein